MMKQWPMIGPSKPFLRCLLASSILSFALVTRCIVYAADSNEPRFYVAIRAGAVVRSAQQVGSGFQTALDGTDVLGLSVGLNFNKYLGAELVADHYEFVLNTPGGKKAAEYNVAPYLAVLRLRYPMLNNKLTPYILGGGGVGLVQVDDKFPPLGSTTLKKNDFSPVGAVGGGVEYFITNNFALGLEAKYLFQQAALGVNGQDNRTNMNALLWGGSLRIYFSEDTTSGSGPPIPSLGEDRIRFYLAFRTGTAIATHPAISPQGSLTGVQGLHFVSGSFGANIGRYWGLELAVDSFEQNIKLQPYGKIGEYTNSSIVPQIRLMYPLLEEKLVPYAVAGVGVGLAEYGGKTQEAEPLTIGKSQSLSVVGAVGVGLEYFVVNNVALTFETKYRIFPSATLEINHVPHSIDVSAVLLSAGLRIFFN